MRHVRGDAENFAGSHDNFFAVDGEFQRAFQDVGDLLVVVMMQRDVRAFFHQHAGEHDFFADDHFAVDQRIEFLAFDAFPWNVFHFCGCAHFISP